MCFSIQCHTNCRLFGVDVRKSDCLERQNDIKAQRDKCGIAKLSQKPQGQQQKWLLPGKWLESNVTVTRIT